MAGWSTGPAPRDPAARGVIGWCLYDWAASAFNTVIGTFVFSVYFARGIYGDETQGSAVWGYAIALSGIAVAVLSPVLGAVADRAGRRKPWLAAFLLVTVAGTALLWQAEPRREDIAFALACVVVASIAFELANVFYNAMLRGVAPEPWLGRISGWGWGIGYLGGLACLAAALFGLVRPEPPPFGLDPDAAEPVRATALLVAAWVAVFALPLFLFAPDEPASGIPLGRAVREGLGTLARTAREIRRYGNVVRYLVASALYRDGLATLFAVGGLYAAGTFGMSFEQILIFAIGLNLSAGLGAGAFAFLDDAAGSKRTVLAALAGLIGFGVPLLLVTEASTFMLLALGLGLFVGPAQAASRSLMARLAPAGMQAEMFGLYALTGKAITFLGPLLFGLATDIFDSQRAGMSTILLFFLAGGALLLTVREPARAGSAPASASGGA